MTNLDAFGFSGKANHFSYLCNYAFFTLQKIAKLTTLRGTKYKPLTTERRVGISGPLEFLISFVIT